MQRLVDLFTNESFGKTEEESKQEFQKKAGLTILANRPKSVLAVKNRSLKQPSNIADALIKMGTIRKSR